MLNHKMHYGMRAVMVLATFNCMYLQALDQKIQALKGTIENLATQISQSSCAYDASVSYPQKSRDAAARYADITYEKCLARAHGNAAAVAACPNKDILKQNYLKSPPSLQFLLDKKSDLHKALMAGLFIDDFNEPIPAMQLVGLASQIYKLIVDEATHKIKPSTARLPGSCFHTRSDLFMESPYKDPNLDPKKNLLWWAQNTFSASSQLSLTAKKLLLGTLGVDKLLRTLENDDYDAAEAFWVADESAAVSSYATTAKRFGRSDAFEQQTVSPLSTAIQNPSIRSIRNKIAQFKDANIKK